MSFTVSSNGKEFEVGLLIRVTIDDVISSNIFWTNVVFVHKRDGINTH